METLHHGPLELSSDELRWARELKSAAIVAARKSDHLLEISDFEYVQYALFTRGNVKIALKRIEMMQHFREEYRINDTPEEGMNLLLRFTREQQPWFMVNIDYSTTQGHFIHVYDYARLQPAKAKYPEDWRIFLGSMYYIYQLSQFNFLACREGVVHICECGGMGFSNFDAKFISQFCYHLLTHYPLVNKECSWMHTTLEANMMQSFYRSIMGPIANVTRVGCHFQGYDGRIDEMFKTPNEEAAEERLLSRYLCYLGIRYHNQATFRLPLPDPPAGPAVQIRPPAQLGADDGDGENEQEE